MHYSNVVQAQFLSRINRFVARVLLNGQEISAHVKNTGRCRELFVPGAAVFLAAAENTNRKTAYDLIAVQKGDLLINVDSHAPNQVFREWVEQGSFVQNMTEIHPEYTYGDSRFDFLLKQGEINHLVEIKGVTLEENGVARFPDAPTERGIKHLNGLIAAREQGFECTLCFVVQMSPVKWVEPNDRTHPAFGDALRRASAAGVRIIAVDCSVTPDTLTVQNNIPVRLSSVVSEGELL